MMMMMMKVSFKIIARLFYSPYEGTEHFYAVISGQLLSAFLEQHLEACMLLNICATENSSHAK